MATYEFFTSCLSTAQEKFKELVNTPRARGDNLADEVKEILEQIRTAKNYDEITVEQADYLTNEFKSIDFTKLSQVRAANKERGNYNVRPRVNY
jgi:hypothetical protein